MQTLTLVPVPSPAAVCSSSLKHLPSGLYRKSLAAPIGPGCPLLGQCPSEAALQALQGHRQPCLSVSQCLSQLLGFRPSSWSFLPGMCCMVTSCRLVGALCHLWHLLCAALAHLVRALQILSKPCLLSLGTCPDPIAPPHHGWREPGQLCCLLRWFPPLREPCTYCAAYGLCHHGFCLDFIVRQEGSAGSVLLSGWKQKLNPVLDGHHLNPQDLLRPALCPAHGAPPSTRLPAGTEGSGRWWVMIPGCPPLMVLWVWWNSLMLA